jgi:hypothetical protein
MLLFLHYEYEGYEEVKYQLYLLINVQYCAFFGVKSNTNCSCWSFDEMADRYSEIQFNVVQIAACLLKAAT